MKSYKQYLLEDYEYSSTQIKLPICIANKITEFADTIPDSEKEIT